MSHLAYDRIVLNKPYGVDVKSKMIFRKTDKSALSVIYNGARVGLIKIYMIRPGNDSFFYPWHFRIISLYDGGEVFKIEWQREDEEISAFLELKPCPAGYVGIFRGWGKGHVIIRLVFEVPSEERCWPFMPAFMYGHNEGGRSPQAMYPQLDDGTNSGPAKPWVAKEWLVRTDRSSHGLTSVITDRLVYAIGGRDVCRYEDGTVAEKTGLGISVTEPQRLSFSLGFSNVPYTYSDVPGRNYLSRPEGFVNLDKGKVSSEFFLFVFSHEGRQTAVSMLLRESYALFQDRVDSAGGIEDGIRTVADALVDYGYCSEANNFYLSLPADERIFRAQLDNFNSAWTGGMRTAYPLLMAGYQLGNERWLNCARSVIANIAKNSLSKKGGLFYENYDLRKKEWNTRGWWYDLLEKPGHSGYVNGQVCHYMLLAYLAEKESGTEHENWLASARRVLEHVADVQGKDGSFGYTYDEENGRILDEDGFSGCWFTPAFATLFRITGERRFLDVAKKAMDFYRRDVADFHVYGGPHDIHKSPDEEGILAWIEAARILHEITKDDDFLKGLLIGLDYEFSWKFAYNVVNEVEPLKSMNWCSRGGSVTSVNNSHIHPMGSAIAASILYATEITDDSYLRARLVDTVRWTLNAYLHYDGHYGWGKKGMINERFCYTDSLLTERFSDGKPAGTWFCAHPWASGAVLEGLTGRILETARGNSRDVLGV